MAQNFVNFVGPAISASWLNGVDVTVNSVLAGSTTVAQALAALGLTTTAQIVTLPLPVAQGGTAAATAVQALANLGGVTSGQVISQINSTVNQNFINALIGAQTPAELAANITPVNLGYLPGNVLRYGTNASPGVTDMTAAIQAAVTAAGFGNYEVYIPAGTYLITSDITVPLGTQWLQGGPGPFAINIRGDGKTQTIIQFSASGTFTNGINLDGGSSIKLGGKISDILFHGNFATPVILTLKRTDLVNVSDCIFRNVQGHGVLVDSSLSFLLSNLYFSGCGSSTQACLEIDGSLNNSTTGVLQKIYVSSGNATSIAGIRIDRSVSIEVIGGASESSGIPIQIGCRSSTASVENIFVHGMDFENPGNGHPFIDIGSGLSGGAFALGITLQSLSGFASTGTTSIPFAVRIQNAIGVHINDTLLVQLGATSYIEMVGTNISGVVVEEHRLLQGTVTWNWARFNGVQIKSWGPQLRCVLGPLQSGVPVCQHSGLRVPYVAGFTLTGTGVGVLANNAVGGYLGFFTMANASPTFVPSLQFGEPGMEIEILAADSNTTLAFGNSGGTVRTISGTDLTMTAGRIYKFVNDGASGSGGSCWVQL